MGIFDISFWGSYLPIIWIAAAVLLGLIEAGTLGLTTIWFAIGAIIAAVAALLGAGFLAQIAVFLAVSVLTLIFTRPIASKKLKVGREKNVTEQMEGKPGLVTEAVTPFGTGLVKVGGVIWTAVGESPELMIEKGAHVTVAGIEGVKLVVKPAAGADRHL
jgi:membrane protein implicated in regulation of membrane protease activity